MRRLKAPLLLAPLMALQFPKLAHAGPVEQLVQLAMHPSDSNVMAVRYINGGGGAFVTTDKGATWKLLCDASMFDYVTIRGGPIVITGDGTTTMGVFTGMWHDDGRSCAWKSEPKVDGLWVASLALDPADPNVAYAATSSGGKMNGLLRRAANGTWSDLGTKEDLLITDLFVTPLGTDAGGSGRRFYVGAVRGEIIPTDGGLPRSNYLVRFSDDDGATWTEHVYGAADGALRLQGVDPTNPDRIVISIERPGDTGTAAETADSVLVSDDRGASFKPYLTVTEIGAVAFAPDGRVWIGDAGNSFDLTQPDGLWFAQSLDVPATKLTNGDYPVQCLGYQASTNTLFACQRWSFGPVDTADGSFTTSLAVRRVSSFVDCTGVDMAATCETQLCNAYCGFGHFAEAPLCCSYGTLTCGPAAAQSAVCPVKPDAGGGREGGTDAGPDGSTAGAGGTAGESATGGEGGRAGIDGAITAGGALYTGGFAGTRGTGGPAATPSNSEGGCCAIAGRQRSSPNSPAALALAVSVLALRRRRRRD